MKNVKRNFRIESTANKTMAVKLQIAPIIIKFIGTYPLTTCPLKRITAMQHHKLISKTTFFSYNYRPTNVLVRRKFANTTVGLVILVGIKFGANVCEKFWLFLILVDAKWCTKNISLEEIFCIIHFGISRQIT